MTDFSDYDYGFRRGVFDKCNGRPCIVARGGDSILWDDGYLDGWDGNENKFPQMEPEPTGSTFDTDQANTPQRFFKLWVEWDYGQDSFVFDTEQAALDWLQRTATDIDDGAEGAMSAQEMFDEGLAGLDIVTLIR